jgi:hypothetical protein
MTKASSEKFSTGRGCILSPDATIEDNVVLGHRVIIDGARIRICSNARIDSGSIVADNVTIGSNAWVRSGSVVLNSVPPNAVVEGNPAKVVGYQLSSCRDPVIKPNLIDFDSVKGSLDRPFKVGLGVGGSELYIMREIVDPRGSLTVGEVPTELPFKPRRYFMVYDVPCEELRGEHAHKECEQFLICVNGSCRVLLDDGIARCEVILDRPDMAVYMPSMVWGTQYRYSSDAVLMVFASLPYSSDDYIRTYDGFMDAVQSGKFRAI